MDRRIGTVFREARNRRKIDLSEVEAATRIRVRYLRAIENEEWDVLPGGVYTRGFIRTYASFLGLDGDRLAEDYRQSVEGGERPAAEQPAPVSASVPGDPTRRPWAALRSGWAAVAAVVLVGAIAIVAIPDGGDGGSETGGTSEGEQAAPSEPAQEPVKVPSPSPGVSVRLAANAEVWVCVLDSRQRPLVDGLILEAGAEEGPFRSGSFTVSFGNGEVSMLIDGREAEIPATSSPIGYSIDASGDLTELDEAERPTCL
jgi:cytoskeleton protein RodZ